MTNRLINAIRSVLTFAILYIFTAVGVVLTLILTLFNLRKPVHIISCMWARSVFFLMGKKYSIKGTEYIDNKRKYIILANHASLFDIVAIMALFPGISWFGHQRLLKIPLFGRLLKMNGYIPFKNPTIRNTKEMIGQLVSAARDKTVAIFPEGTRTLDGKINDFYRGFIYLLRHNDSDILPVTLNGFYKLKPKNRTHINFNAKLEIIIHKPVSRDKLTPMTDLEIIDTIKIVIGSAYKKES